MPNGITTSYIYIHKSFLLSTNFSEEAFLQGIYGWLKVWINIIFPKLPIPLWGLSYDELLLYHQEGVCISCV